MYGGSERRIFSGTELMNLPPDPDNYLVESMLWEQQCVMLLAKEKVGKSIFAVQMACALSCGRPFLDHYEVSEPMQVLYIQTESTREETTERLRSMVQEGGVSWNPDNFHLLHTEALALDTEHGLSTLIGLINTKSLRPKVIFLDPLYMSMQGSLNEELSARHMCGNIRRLIAAYNCAVVVPHHEHRPRYMKDSSEPMDEGDNAVMGSFVWKSFVSHVLHLRKKTDGLRALTCTTQRSDRVIKDMDMVLSSNPLHYHIVGHLDHPGYYDRVHVALAEDGQPSTIKKICEISELSEAAVKKALAYLTKPNVLKAMKTNPGRRPALYQIKTDSLP